MTDTVVTTAEQELRGLLDWLKAKFDGKEPFVITEEIRRRLDVISRGHDGWRSRCLLAEKRNGELVSELRMVREQLMDLQHAGAPG